MTIDYGVNNLKSSTDLCINSELHDWVFLKRISRCYCSYFCSVCNAQHRIDSSD